MKSDYFMNLKWSIRPILISIRRQLLNRKGEWIMGRVACMGQDVLKNINVDVPIINIQKGRVDYLNKITENIKLRTRTHQVITYIDRDDIKGLISQQEILYRFSKKPPIALYMDSYSELTDQLFYHKKQNWYFCANYSDIIHTPEFEREFVSIGLLPIDNLLEHYRLFFCLFRQLNKSVPIIFLNFPVKLDSREKFKIRYRYIKDAIEQIAREFSNFYSITVDEDIIDWPEELVPRIENFPYHFNKRTYQAIAEQVIATGVFNQFNNF